MASEEAELIRLLKPQDRGPVFRKAFVSTATEDHIKVKFGSISATEVDYEIRCLTNEVPQVNDTVWLMVQGSVMLCVGVESDNKVTWHVDDDTGDDANDGSASSPLATVEEAARRIRRFAALTNPSSSFSINIVNDYVGDFEVANINIGGTLYIQGELDGSTKVTGRVSLYNINGQTHTNLVLRRMEIENTNDSCVYVRGCNNVYMNDLVIRQKGTGNDTIMTYITGASSVYARGISCINDATTTKNYAWYADRGAKLIIRNEETDDNGGVVYSTVNSGVNFLMIYRCVEGGQAHIYETGGPELPADGGTYADQMFQTFGGGSGVWEDTWHFVDATGEPAYENSWTHNAASQNARFRAVGNMVYMTGVLKSGTIGSTVFTLPASYRPAYLSYFPCIDGNGNASYISINNSTGAVVVQSLNSISSTPFVVGFDLSFLVD